MISGTNIIVIIHDIPNANANNSPTAFKYNTGGISSNVMFLSNSGNAIAIFVSSVNAVSNFSSSTTFSSSSSSAIRNGVTSVLDESPGVMIFLLIVGRFLFYAFFFAFFLFCVFVLCCHKREKSYMLFSHRRSS